MSFDVYGVKAKSERGDCFKNNRGWWMELAGYVLENIEMPEEEGWAYNDGQYVCEADALKIADTLDRLIAEGHTAEYESKHKAFSVENVKDFAEFCRNSGEFVIR